MKLTQIQPHIYQVGLGIVNAFLVNDGRELTLIDTGIKSSDKAIVKAIGQLGYNITALRHIILTHCHGDHVGAAASLQKQSGARVYAHSIDAALIENGHTARPSKPLKASPGLINWLITTLFIRDTTKATPVKVDVRVEDGQHIPIGKGFQVIFTPGHCSGHISLLYDGVLFAGDLCGNMGGLNYSLVYEDIAEGRCSIQKVAAHNFNTACFGHGKPILNNAAKIMGLSEFYK